MMLPSIAMAGKIGKLKAMDCREISRLAGSFFRPLWNRPQRAETLKTET
jgi:hypothetical protein